MSERGSMPPVTLEREGAVARVTLNRPAQLNAISPDLLDALDGVCAELERDASIKVATLTGSGRVFCAGADLKVVEEYAPDPERWRGFMELWHRVFNRVEALPQVVIAGVHGLALAGGLELVLVCDLAVADEEARIGDQHANFGLVAGGGGSQRLPRVIGERRAKELMYLGGWLSARQALEWGLVNRVAPAGKLHETLAELTADLATKSAAASGTVKTLVHHAHDVDLMSGLELERAATARHMQSADAKEGLRAFAEKRRPSFR
jgi:enoyl-CoA hydratase/carnithine racemase